MMKQIVYLLPLILTNDVTIGFQLGKSHNRHYNHNQNHDCNQNNNNIIPTSSLLTSTSTRRTRTSSTTTTTGSLPAHHRLPIGTTTQLQFYNDLEADYGELFAGGQRYAMVELPDSMVDTTLFVGNLCEFVTDDMLSNLFQQASSLKFVPACVARKPNMSSLKYGFVTFPTITEKENAIIKFTGYELNNKKMKVEEIHDYKYRVRVPEKLVVYAVGEIKHTREGGKNTMRKVTNSREADPSTISLSSSSYSMSHAATSKNRKKKKRTQCSSSSMSDSLGERGGYKNMKRKQKRKQRRAKNGNWDDFGLSC